jgi:putative DNA primase/helicase
MQSEVKVARPKALRLKHDQIPHELRKRPQWVCWNYTLQSGKWTKPPVRPDGGHVDSTDASTWSTFEKCWGAYDRNECTGLGFVTASNDPYVLVDLDHVRNAEGTTDAWAQAILDAAHQERAYIEWSVSGEGYHIIGRGRQGFAGRKRNDAELYCQGRYFTITGHVPPGMQCDIIGKLDTTITMVQARIGDSGHEDGAAPIVGQRPYPDNMTDDDILQQHAYPSKNGPWLRKLLQDGDTSGYSSDSEADLACANELAFWFWLDADAIERVMLNSALSRPKWSKNKHYLRHLTITKALTGKHDYYGKELSISIRRKSPKVVAADNDAFDYTKHLTKVQRLIDNPPAPIEYLLPGLLAKGACSLLVGKPKSFKSTLAAQVAIALSGNEWMLNHWTEFGDVKGSYRVAIIDYEQSEPIAAHMVRRFNVKNVNDLLRIDKFVKLDETGVAELRKLILEQRLDLVIIDSLTRAAPAPTRGSNSVFGHEGEYVQRITNLAHETGCHINMIAHAGKRGADDDPMQMIAGTNAVPASVDDVMVLYKDGDDQGDLIRRKLFISGRHIPRHGTYVLEKQGHEACFILRGSEEIYINGETRKLILAALRPGIPMSPKEIGDAIDRDKSQVHRALKGLLQQKIITWLPPGKYTTVSAATESQVRSLRERNA